MRGTISLQLQHNTGMGRAMSDVLTVGGGMQGAHICTALQRGGQRQQQIDKERRKSGQRQQQSGVVTSGSSLSRKYSWRIRVRGRVKDIAIR